MHQQQSDRTEQGEPHVLQAAAPVSTHLSLPLASSGDRACTCVCTHACKRCSQAQARAHSADLPRLLPPLQARPSWLLALLLPPTLLRLRTNPLECCVFAACAPSARALPAATPAAGLACNPLKQMSSPSERRQPSPAPPAEAAAAPPLPPPPEAATPPIVTCRGSLSYRCSQAAKLQCAAHLVDRAGWADGAVQQLHATA